MSGDRRVAGPRQNGGPVALIAAVVALAVVAGLVYLFVLKDDDKKSDEPTTLAEQTYTQDTVPFTFAYPGRFAVVNPPAAGFLWIAGVGPYDILDVKRLANEERSLAATKTSVRQSLTARPDLKILGEGTETAGSGQKMVRFTVDSTVNGQTLHSTLFYFSMSGASWQLECQATDAGRAEIDAACDRALATFAAK